MKKIVLLYAFMIPFVIFAQSFDFGRIDNTSGLSDNQVKCIFKDSRGFMWFGTNYGLNRYDGYEMKVYKSNRKDSMGLASNSIDRIQEDADGHLWINTGSTYNLYSFKTEKFSRNIGSYLTSLGINFIPAMISFDAHKNMYLYRTAVGLYKYDVKLHQLILYRQSASTGLSKGSIVAIRSYNNFIWVLFRNGLLQRINERLAHVDLSNDFIVQHSGSAFLTKELFVDQQGSPWVFPAMGDKGIACLDPVNLHWTYFGTAKSDSPSDRFVPILNDFVRDVRQQRNGNVWIATDHGGVSVYNKLTGEKYDLRNDTQNQNSLAQNSAISLFCDNSDIMWVGTYKNGISYYYPGMFKFKKSVLADFHHPALENKDCNSIYKDSKNNLWLGTNGSGLLKYDASTSAFQLFRFQKNNNASISSDIIVCSAEDKNGEMWFGTFLGGLIHQKGAGFERFQVDPNNPNSLSNNSVYGLSVDKNNRIWIGTLGGGVDMYDPLTKVFYRHDTAKYPSMTSNYILSMNPTGSSVFLCSSSGIDILNTDNGSISPFFSKFDLKNNLSDQSINNVYFDSRKLLWIATDNGINVYDKHSKTFTYIGLNDGLPGEQVVSVVEDKMHNIWVGTRNGLAYIRILSAKNRLRFSVVSFDESDGLPGSIFNPNAVCVDKNGNIYEGCTKGFVVFNPTNIQFNQLAPCPRVSSLRVGNQLINPGDEYRGRVILENSITESDKIELKYDERNFTIRFSALSFVHSAKNKYKYRLNGLDNDWVVSKTGEISYSNLSQGTYELVVYACNNDNVWSKNPLVLQIKIRPPWWLTWWAIACYIIFILVFIWMVISLNLMRQKKEFENETRIMEARKQHEMDEMKFRFFTNISHEFRTPLALILNPSEKLLKEDITDEQRNLLQIIHRNASGLLSLVNQLLDFRKLDVRKDTLNPSVGDLVSFVREICYSFSEHANKKSISFAFVAAIAELKVAFDSEKMQKIIYNLLSNAFKFTPDNGKIDVQISMLHSEDNMNWIRIAIIDSGIGIPEKDHERIFDRFYRVENQDNGHQTGTGIGLHIVSEYVKLHNGKIKVESKHGQGAAFVVLLPFNQVVEEILSANASAEVSSETTSPELTQTDQPEPNEKQPDSNLPLMLIIDDNEDFRNFIAAMFVAKYRIITASDGDSGLKQTLAHIPDLVICDVMMPKVDGYEYCRMLKSDIRLSHIPVLLLTAKTGDENKYKGLEVGAEDYISKPFNTDILVLKVDRIIERQRMNKEVIKKKISINPSEVEITSMDEKFVRKAVSLVEANIDKPDFLVEDLCREMGMSRVYFYKKILSLTDKTPSEFIRYIRLKRAADLFQGSQLFVNEVAYQVGFNDPKYFRKYFKQEFGMSPVEYKKKFENKQ